MIREADFTHDTFPAGPHNKVLLVLVGIVQTAVAAGLPLDLSEAYYTGISRGLALAGTSPWRHSGTTLPSW
jgi:hypothetical protein